MQVRGARLQQPSKDTLRFHWQTARRHPRERLWHHFPPLFRRFSCCAVIKAPRACMQHLPGGPNSNLVSSPGYSTCRSLCRHLNGRLTRWITGRWREPRRMTARRDSSQTDPNHIFRGYERSYRQATPHPRRSKRQLQ